MYEIKNKTYFITEKFLSWWHIKIEFYEVYPYHFRSNENYILSSVYFLDFLIIITETGNSWNLKLYFLNNKFIHFLNYSEKCGLHEWCVAILKRLSTILEILSKQILVINVENYHFFMKACRTVKKTI